MTNWKGKCKQQQQKDQHKPKKDSLTRKMVEVFPVSLLRQNQIILNEWQLVMKCRKITKQRLWASMSIQKKDLSKIGVLMVYII